MKPLLTGDVWITSDTHFGHRAILKYCNRPWWYSQQDPPTDADIQAMNRGLENGWNGIVKPGDTVIHAGDFAMGNKGLWPEYRKKLNGRIIMVGGNHDRNADYMVNTVGIDEFYEELELVLDGFKVHVRHYPLGKHDGDVPEEFGDYDYRLCGHIHEKWRNRGSEINVGVDVWHWKPRAFKELITGIPPRQIPKLNWDAERHHNVEKKP